MTIDPNNAGPFGIGLNSDLPGDGTRREFGFDNIKTGPNNKEGWLQKVYGEKGGMDYIYIDNGTEYRIKVEASGGKYTEVPAATSIEITGEGLRHCTLSQDSGTVISASDVTVMVGNKVRNGSESNQTGVISQFLR